MPYELWNHSELTPLLIQTTTMRREILSFIYGRLG
jgi:hypothetical protein